MHQWLQVAYDPAWLRDASGYIAASLVLSTFSVTSMRRLRLLGVGSNVAFICYAILEGMLPILISHGLLLPINISNRTG
jgi:CRP/FNR family transcriptional regulator, cyclic AMP receptor protein